MLFGLVFGSGFSDFTEAAFSSLILESFVLGGFTAATFFLFRYFSASGISHYFLGTNSPFGGFFSSLGGCMRGDSALTFFLV